MRTALGAKLADTVLNDTRVDIVLSKESAKGLLSKQAFQEGANVFVPLARIIVARRRRVITVWPDRRCAEFLPGKWLAPEALSATAEQESVNAGQRGWESGFKDTCLNLG